MAKLFIIAVGGTGMRCLESFTHMAAAGMLEDSEIEILTLDTDQTNGNKARAEQLLDLYNRIKTNGGNSGGSPNKNTFFSSKLNVYNYHINYSSANRKSYKNIVQITSGNLDTQRANKLVSNLFLTEGDVQEFDLSHGYRAQTHLGSLLMYHALVETAQKIRSGYNIEAHDQDLDKFILKLQAEASNARVFVFGSIFGGTGASSIPVLPRAIQDYVKIRSGGTSTIDLKQTSFGATLVTEYFSFPKPDDAQKSTKENSIIADSTYFPLNSQAALQFYHNDKTVKDSYKSLYHVGWPISNIDYGNHDGKVSTGGAMQANSCHIVELVAACAAYHFFKRSFNEKNAGVEFLYKTVPFDGKKFNFSFDDFVGNQNKEGETFANKLGALFSLAHIVLTANEGATGGAGIKGFIRRFEDQKMKEYSTITDKECSELNEYFQNFAYSFKDGVIKQGWIYQIKDSLQGGSFLFNNSAFPKTSAELDKLDVGAIFDDDKYHWEKPLIFGNRYSTFVKKLPTSGPLPEQKVSGYKEQFLAHLYNALTKSQNFNL